MTLAIRPVEARDLEPLSRLYAAAFGAAAPVANPEHLRWKYLDSPAGRAVAASHIVDGRVTGSLAVMPQTFRRNGQTLRAGNVVDLAVDPDFRSMRVALALAQSLQRFTEFDFLYMFPNAVGCEFWEKLGQLKEVRTLNAFAIPLRARRLLDARPVLRALMNPVLFGWRTALKAFSADEAEKQALGDALARDWLSNSSECWVSDRAAGFYSWRFGGDQHRRAEVWAVGPEGRWGHVVWRDTEALGVRARILLEAAVNEKAPAHALRGFWMSFAGDAAKRGLDLALWLNGDPREPAKRAACFPWSPVPAPFAPQRFSIYVVANTDVGRNAAANFSFSLADGDVF